MYILLYVYITELYIPYTQYLDDVLSGSITVGSTVYYRASITCTHTCRVASGGIY